MVIDGVYTGDINAPPDVSAAALAAAGAGLGRPGLNVSGTFGIPVTPVNQVGVNVGAQLIWNWGTLTFDEYLYYGPWLSLGVGDPVTAGGNLGIVIVYDLPWDDPYAYEGLFNDYALTVNPDGIGGYIDYAVPPGDGFFGPGDGPWSIGAGLNLGTRGVGGTWSPTNYVHSDHIDTWRQDPVQWTFDDYTEWYYGQ